MRRRARSTGEAVKSAGPLKEQIDRRQVGDHDIEVHVQALLDDLGRH
jgi:hypothetical protein